MQYQGIIQPGYEPVGRAFIENFTERKEVGASVAVYHHGKLVVNIWGGKANAEAGEDWAEDTLAMIFSSTKGLVATACLMAVERGLLELDAPVSRYWPGLGTGPREAITVRHLLNHRSGLIAIEEPVTIDDLHDHEKMVAILERQTPAWEPGTQQGYHGVTYGFYVGELFRRAVGRTVGTFIREEIAGPLNADVHLGLDEKHDPRVAPTITVGAWERIIKALPYVLFNDVVERKLIKAITKKDSYTARAFGEPAELGTKGVQNFNQKRVRRLELGYANAYATAEGLARVYAALSMGGSLDGVTLVSPESLAPIRERQSFQTPDNVLHKPLGWSQGFIKEEPHIFCPHLESFGHPGAGGALGFCDPTQELAWSYIMNRMDFRLRSPRAIAISRALYDCEPVDGVMPEAPVR